ncbi:NTP transferase domain-containing protein [Clostridium bovifaecis]|uniref:NTP transferase domain-containing protein n=1 Tax=Clostridium bovifaecis TaxID=2184719 RepID=A0A6I6F2Z9_9CLOT|nr:NTP transferase domain-containing protein [Clostridium bovifaecis]
MKAIIMAGGLGSRLRPLTCNTPKSMMPIMDKPIMQYIIELLKRNGIENIGITVQYLADEIIRYFGDGSRFGVRIRYFVEDVPLGTAGSVKNAENFLDDTFIVISGDSLTDIDISKVTNYHKRKKATGTLVLKEVQVPLEYGVVVTDKENRITGFLEKPSWSEVISDKVNTGMYILEPQIFSYYKQNEKFDFSGDLFPILINNNEALYAYVIDDYWCDIGNVQQYNKCHADIFKGLTKIKIKGEKYRDKVWVGEGCEISLKSKIVPPVFIGSNTKIYADAQVGPYAVLGKNNIVSTGATIKRSILFDNCYIGNNAEIRGAVLCRNVQLESRVSIFEDAALGDDTLVETKSVVKPGIKIWPNKVIETSTVVKSNIIWGGKLYKALFGKRGISGGINIDITPEFASKLGSAYGSLLKYGSTVAISCSDDGSAQMIKYSLATGLLSIGIEVYDLKKMTTVMTRHAVKFFGVSGAIHVVTDKDNSQKITLLFMNEDGIDIEKSMERKIENSFIREDFRRIKADAFKNITQFSDNVEYYIRTLISQLEIHEIRDRKYKIVLSTRNPLISSIVMSICCELQVGIKLYEASKDLAVFSKQIIENKANFGVYISDEGEYAIFIDEKGNIIKDDSYEALKYFIMLKYSKMNTLVVPVTSSESIKQIATMYGAKFIRSKTSHKSILDEYINSERNLTKREIINGYLLTLDAIAISMFTLNLMAGTNLSLFKIISRLPRYYNKKQEVMCPWNIKGRIMRNLIEENTEIAVELIEGVKFNYKDAWVLVIPDAEEPLCRIYAESENLQLAERVSNEFVEKIKRLVNENSYIENKSSTFK